MYFLIEVLVVIGFVLAASAAMAALARTAGQGRR